MVDVRFESLEALRFKGACFVIDLRWLASAGVAPDLRPIERLVKHNSPHSPIRSVGNSQDPPPASAPSSASWPFKGWRATLIESHPKNKAAADARLKYNISNGRGLRAHQKWNSMVLY